MDKDKQANLDEIRHSAAHLLAAAVLEIWPDAKPTIGPAIENGFYYDFEFPEKVSESDLKQIEKKMKELVKHWQEFERIEVSKEEALAKFDHNPYKKELIEEFAQEGKTLTLYKSGDFVDLCRGGHVEEPKKELRNFKLLNMAGAYWRGDEKNQMLTRIYGTAFATKDELKDYLAMMEEARRRDHRKLGQEMDLFLFSELVGPGLPLWTPKGTILRNLLDDFVWQERRKRGYSQVEIPHITKKELYQKSGHWDKFADELFKITTREGHEFAMKPMNCPHHTQIFARKPFSYKQMPQRYASTTMCYRDEQTGELSGLSRVRSFTQDDAHVFCRQDQVQEEALRIWDIVDSFYGAMGFDLELRLSLSDPAQPENYLGDRELWEKAEQQLREMAKGRGVDYTEQVGEAAFYGPKLDFMGKDSLGREWQVATIQLDMNMPERFDLYCINEEGAKERIIMIHAAIMGSIERFLSILIEHFAGKFPVWLSPEQVRVLPIADRHHEYAQKVVDELHLAGLRVELDASAESLNKKIRNAQLEKVPYMLILGDQEVEGQLVNVRHRDQKDQNAMSMAEFRDMVLGLVANKE